MKGIFYCEGFDFSNNNIGVENKIKLQIKYLKKIGDLEVVSCVFSNTLIEKIKFLLPFILSDREKKRHKLLDAIDKKTNYLYIRKPSLSNDFYKVLKRAKQINSSLYIMMEIPTYPFHSEYSGLSKIMNIKSIICEKKLKNVIDCIITYSDDKYIWGIPTLNISNCVEYYSIIPRSKNYHIKPGVIRLTCVAKFMYWHGLDRLIRGIHEYKGNRQIVLNVVGNGNEIDRLRILSQNDKNIIFHGSKTGDDLSKIFNDTDIAVDALGRHRSGVYYNSSLKGKEYSARGIPSISSVMTELDFFDNYDFYLKLPSDDSSINVNTIIEFFDRINSNYTCEEITNNIRNITYNYFDYEYGFKNKIESLLSNVFEGDVDEKK